MVRLAHLVSILVTVLMAVPAAAQHRMGASGMGAAGRGGFRGFGGHAGAVIRVGPGRVGPGGGLVAGGTVGHRVIRPVVRPFRFGAFGYFGPGFRGYVPYSYGGPLVYLGGAYGSNYLGGFGSTIPVPITVPAGAAYAPQPQQPTIIIIQMPPAERGASAEATTAGASSYRQPPAVPEDPPYPAQASRSRPTLLVTKDHSMYAVSDYWVEGHRLHYVFSYGVEKSMPLDQLDLDFTRKLNEERGVKVELKSKP